MPKSGQSALAHVDERGVARMVDVTAKPVTARSATATGSVRMSHQARRLLVAGELAKGDALAVARIAGIAAAKRTPDLVPLCHPVAVGSVAVEVEPDDDGVRIVATVATADRTGIEMEALTCVVVAALTVVDMVKAVDRDATIGPARITEKTGGRSGDWRLGADGRLGVDVPTATAALADVPATLAGRGALVVTVSDRCAAGTATDESGPEAAALLSSRGAEVSTAVVPDGLDDLRDVVQAAIDAGTALVLTTGGTGVGPRDVTPEALAPLVNRRLPGLEHAVRAASGKPAAMLSRAVVGVADRTVVIALPGSPRAVREGIDALDAVLGHLLDQVTGGDHAHPASEATP